MHATSPIPPFPCGADQTARCVSHTRSGPASRLGGNPPPNATHAITPDWGTVGPCQLTGQARIELFQGRKGETPPKRHKPPFLKSSHKCPVFSSWDPPQPPLCVTAMYPPPKKKENSRWLLQPMPASVTCATNEHLPHGMLCSECSSNVLLASPAWANYKKKPQAAAAACGTSTNLVITAPVPPPLSDALHPAPLLLLSRLLGKPLFTSLGKLVSANLYLQAVEPLHPSFNLCSSLYQYSLLLHGHPCSLRPPAPSAT